MKKMKRKNSIDIDGKVVFMRLVNSFIVVVGALACCSAALVVIVVVLI